MMRPLLIDRQRALSARISRAGKRTQTTACLQSIASLLIREGADGSLQQTTACPQGIVSLLICGEAAGRERRQP